MINTNKVKFATQADSEILKALREMAAKEGRQLQILVDEAFREYLTRKQNMQPRQHVMAALDASLLKYDELYRELAK